MRGGVTLQMQHYCRCLIFNANASPAPSHPHRTPTSSDPEKISTKSSSARPSNWPENLCLQSRDVGSTGQNTSTLHAWHCSRPLTRQIFQKCGRARWPRHRSAHSHQTRSAWSRRCGQPIVACREGAQLTLLRCGSTQRSSNTANVETGS